jgi:hypothetical protein
MSISTLLLLNLVRRSLINNPDFKNTRSQGTDVPRQQSVFLANWLKYG